MKPLPDPINRNEESITRWEKKGKNEGKCSFGSWASLQGYALWPQRQWQDSGKGLISCDEESQWKSIKLLILKSRKTAISFASRLIFSGLDNRMTCSEKKLALDQWQQSSCKPTNKDKATDWWFKKDEELWFSLSKWILCSDRRNQVTAKESFETFLCLSVTNELLNQSD